MSNFLKWIGGGIGWALGGPIGAILGFALGSAIGGSSTKKSKFIHAPQSKTLKRVCW